MNEVVVKPPRAFYQEWACGEGCTLRLEHDWLYDTDRIRHYPDPRGELAIETRFVRAAGVGATLGLLDAFAAWHHKRDGSLVGGIGVDEDGVMLPVWPLAVYDRDEPRLVWQFCTLVPG